jgi:hypothetical protein
MKRRNRDDSTVGEDSFLDTTANLVGILIILVVVVGVKTKVDAEAHGKAMVLSDRSQELEEPLRQAVALEDSYFQQLMEIEEYELETEYRRLERNAILEQVALTRDAAQQKLDQLDQDQQSRVEKNQRLEHLQSELDKVAQQMGSQEEQNRPEIILEHLPTPMARTVFQKELHVMLMNRRLSVIPWDRLVEILKEQIPLAAQRQASRGALEDTLGPVQGFLMKYRMAAIPGGFELDRFELQPTESVMSESMDQVLNGTSRLTLELVKRNPRETVVTVWVYPDSFDDFRDIKAYLFSEGFLCAARPLPEGVRIGASPRGSRSSAQ